MYELRVCVCVYICERAQDRDTLCSAAEADVGSGNQWNDFGGSAAESTYMKRACME